MTKRTFQKVLARDIDANPKSLYSYVRSKTRVKDVVSPLENTAETRGEYVTDSEEICKNKQLNVVGELSDTNVEGSENMLSEINMTRKGTTSRLKQLLSGAT